MGAGLFINELITEDDGAVINGLAALKAAEVTEAARGWNQSAAHNFTLTSPDMSFGSRSHEDGRVCGFE